MKQKRRAKKQELQHHLIKFSLSEKKQATSQSSVAVKAIIQPAAEVWWWWKTSAPLSPKWSGNTDHIPVWLQECWLARTARTMWKWAAAVLTLMSAAKSSSNQEIYLWMHVQETVLQIFKSSVQLSKGQSSPSIDYTNKITSSFHSLC